MLLGLMSILTTAANSLADLTQSQSWTLDAQGNWTGLASNGGTAQSRTHNSQNQITQVGSATLSFDAAGNMTTDEQGRTLKYDAWNRLVKVEQNGNVVSQYQYDGLKRRITEQQGTQPQRVLYYSANWQVLEERESGVVQAQQVWSPVYVDALILRDRNADGNNTNGPNGDGLEQRHYVAQDANFNVTALIGATTGAVVERYYYQAYGVPTVLDANFVPRVNGQSQFAWRYLHQGGRFDWAAGLYHFRNRDLSPTLGRWINHDPIGFEGSKWNLYEYVEGRPTVATDSNGLKTLGQCNADFEACKREARADWRTCKERNGRGCNGYLLLALALCQVKFEICKDGIKVLKRCITVPPIFRVPIVLPPHEWPDVPKGPIIGGPPMA